jgi:hypothetical protein
VTATLEGHANDGGWTLNSSGVRVSERDNVRIDVPPERPEAATGERDRDEVLRVTAYRRWQRRKTELAANTQRARLPEREGVRLGAGLEEGDL